MKKIFLAGFIPLIFFGFPLIAQEIPQKVKVKGKIVEVKITDLKERKPLQPIVILEAGLSEDLAIWNQVFDQVSEFSPVMSYNRAGIGFSDLSDEKITIKSRVKQLHSLLEEMKIDPPYILVGNNWGTEMIREYGATFPNDVMGMVYIDPVMDLDNVEKLSAYLDEKGLDGELLASEYLNFQKSRMIQNSLGIQEEVISLLALLEENKLDWKAKELPQMNTVVILGRRNDMFPMMSRLSMDSREFFKTIIAGKVDFFEQYLLEKQKSSLVLSPGSMNYLPNQEPTQIALSIRQLIFADMTSQIMSAGKTLEPETFEEYLEGLETYVPKSMLKEREYNMLGYSLMRFDRNEQALVILQKNMENHPESANVYDSYGEGLLAVGKVEEAVPMFEKAVELGAISPHRDLELFRKNLAKGKELLAEQN